MVVINNGSVGYFQDDKPFNFGSSCHLHNNGFGTQKPAESWLWSCAVETYWVPSHVIHVTMVKHATQQRAELVPLVQLKESTHVIGHLTALTQLDLSHTDVTDSDLQHLMGLQHLRVLVLHSLRTALHDEGLPLCTWHFPYTISWPTSANPSLALSGYMSLVAVLQPFILALNIW